MTGGNKCSSSLGLFLTISLGIILLNTPKTIVVSFTIRTRQQHSLAMDPRKRWTRSHLFALGVTRRPTRLASTSTKHMASLFMRDRSSSYWFSVGDQVQVVEDVFTKKENLRGKLGRVVETWEKCDVDPTCCCAEQVDTDMAVRVLFEGNDGEDGDNEKRSGNDSNDSAAFYYYFAEEELAKV